MRKLVEEDELSKAAEALGKAQPHESALQHVTGAAHYVDDTPLPRDVLYVATGQSPLAAGRIAEMNLAEVKRSPGVVDCLIAADVPGSNDVSPVYTGDLLFADGRVDFHRQTLMAVAASSQQLAEAAASRFEVVIEPEAPRLTVDQALRADDFVLPTRVFRMGEPRSAIASAEHQLEGRLHIRGQEHFYLEGQVAVAVPTETGGVKVTTSSQHPTEVQKLIADVLAVPINEVQVTVRRMGGAFGGKETQAAPLACIAALFAVRTGRTVKYRMPRRDDMVQTGKRHDFEANYVLGFDHAGRLKGAEIGLSARCGYSADLSEGIVDRAMFHADNAYSLGEAEITGRRLKTHTVSNTAFRGFGGPQGMLTIESAMDEIADYLNEDPVDIRLTNLYRPGASLTPYGQEVTDFRLRPMMEQLIEDARYRERRAEINAFNQTSSYLRKGLALTPVKFGVAFTATHLNQAGALIHIYTDGSVYLNHGGTEMGQGLFTKVQQVLAGAFGIGLERIKVTAAATHQVPNTSPTAASSGTDLNAMAVLDAAKTLKQRLTDFLVSEGAGSDLHFEGSQITDGVTVWSWVDVIQRAYLNRVSLSATGFYKTPDIYFDKEAGRGRPFYYYAFGAACAEVIVDSTTGEYRVTQVDILHDVGRSINPAIDRGQIEGGFVQGLGWLTTEELLWNNRGELMSNSPSNYKIPTAFDVPERFNVGLYQKENPEATVYHSKAVGEPPLMLAISAWCALRDACRQPEGQLPGLGVPATPEQVYWALKGEASNAYRGDLQ